MPYKYLEDIATADIAFEAWGNTLEEMFVAAADATMNVMVWDLKTITSQRNKKISAEADALDMLLFRFLQELIFFKDAERLLLRTPQVSITTQDGHYTLQADAEGEVLNPEKHDLVADVKAVTLHRFRVEKTSRGWEATVILDV